MVEWLNFENCPVCSRRNIVLFKKGNFPPHNLGPEAVKITDSSYGRLWSLFLCQDCGHIFANPCPSPSTVAQLYRQINDPAYEEEAAGRAQNFKPILNQLDRYFPQKGKLLDIGAATGIFLALAREKGWEVSGIEPSVWAVGVAAKKYNLDLIPASFEEAKLPANYFQVVTMIDFIEHIPHPLEAVRKAAHLLEPLGVLVIVTPNIKSLAARVAGAKWWHFRPAHLAFFTASSLQKLLAEAGFQTKKSSSYSWTFSLFYLISRFRFLRPIWNQPKVALLTKKVRVKLALGDSFLIYAQKKE